MGRISPSNLVANRKAYERVRNHGASILSERWRDPSTMRDVELLIITMDLQPIAKREFSDWDEEVRLNAQTSWLNKLADELDYWQSKS
ncbi:dGTP triphosphohydrolase inhibitor [Dickeya phage Ninurta]|uniref:dGTP triphosphohydrolase inhibitor n=1 Tax=Dickeya phage Ninurta TaxID=2163631 RepID=A0A2S1GTA5_9CAUD|nr:dGTP triphosphohydrolase inhibitor [Dickeya phage Ninurta]AWD92627.1 dGTP triphosphohydrolase inhibitor [Dickeya phage Ninurta]